MKKIILIIAFISISVLSKAQCDLPYKSLSEFKNDTTTFITYNYKNRSNQYIGKTLNDIYKDLPIQYIESTRNHNIVRLYMYLYNEEKEEYICWEKEDPANINLPKNEDIIYERYKNYKIREIGVILSTDTSQKSKTQNEPRGYIKNGRMVYRWKTGR